MFITKPSKLALTLVLYFALAATLVATVEAKGFAAVPLHRRDHVDINRMMKKRAGSLSNLAGDFPPTNGAASDPPTDSNSNTGANTSNGGGDSNGNGGNAGGNGSSASSSTPSQSASVSAPAAPSSSAVQTLQSQSASASQSSSAASSPASSSSASQSASGNPLNSIVNGLLPSSSSSASTTAPAPQTSASLNLQPEPSPIPENQGTSIQSVTVTSQYTSASQSPTAAADKADTPQGSSKLSHTALVIIIVVASCVGGIAIIWTGIRKWKFRPSKDFEDRMQPIDWQPTDHDSGLPTHRRVPSNASSFHSSGHESTGSAPLNPIPDHDFTAGASLAPVGGYADLARGPSTGPYGRGPSPGPMPYRGPSPGPYRGPSAGPQMQEALTRGPSLTRTDPYGGVPLHHQGGGGYPLQNPYDQTGY